MKISQCNKFIDVYFLIKKILLGVSIGRHVHSAGDAEVCNKVLNE